MKNDNGRFDTGGKLDSLQGVTLGQFAFARAVGGELIEIGRGIGDAHRQRTEVVETGNFYFTGCNRFDDAGEKAETDSVAEFGVLKTEIANFPEHGAAIGVAMGVPAGGEGVHGMTLRR